MLHNSQTAQSLLATISKRKVCVIVPTYNNSGTLGEVITKVSHHTKDLYIVNDGATDSTSEIITAFPFATVISYPLNVGKGWALRQAFKAAVNDGYNHAITIDSDGQHYPADIPSIVAHLELSENSLVIGSRNMNQEAIPLKSSFGNKFSNFWFWVETGLTIPDTQSGYRMYPISLLKNLRFYSYKFEFEIEVIVRAAWQGIAIIPSPISVYYAERKSRITHFRPFKDFSRIGVLNTILVASAFLYIKPLSLLKKLSRAI